MRTVAEIATELNIQLFHREKFTTSTQLRDQLVFWVPKPVIFNHNYVQITHYFHENLAILESPLNDINCDGSFVSRLWAAK